MPLSYSILHPRPIASLYRQVLKSIPKVMVMYDLDMSENQIKTAVRNLFRKYGEKPLDRSLLDRLLFTGEQDLKETLEQWKQKAHVHRLLDHDGNNGIYKR
jgi:NADH dehydrogenase (ubiquinone) 1 alpha subcomplex subunit 6